MRLLISAVIYFLAAFPASDALLRRPRRTARSAVLHDTGGDEEFPVVQNLQEPSSSSSLSTVSSAAQTFETTAVYSVSTATQSEVHPSTTTTIAQTVTDATVLPTQSTKLDEPAVSNTSQRQSPTGTAITTLEETSTTGAEQLSTRIFTGTTVAANTTASNITTTTTATTISAASFSTATKLEVLAITTAGQPDIITGTSTTTAASLLTLITTSSRKPSTAAETDDSFITVTTQSETPTGPTFITGTTISTPTTRKLDLPTTSAIIQPGVPSTIFIVTGTVPPIITTATTRLTSKTTRLDDSVTTTAQPEVEPTVPTATGTEPPMIITTGDRLTSTVTRLKDPVATTTEPEIQPTVLTATETVPPIIITTAGRLTSRTTRLDDPITTAPLPEVQPTVPAATETVPSIIVTTAGRLISRTTRLDDPVTTATLPEAQPTVPTLIKTVPPIIITTVGRVISASTRLDIPVTAKTEPEAPSAISAGTETVPPIISTTAGRLISTSTRLDVPVTAATQPEAPSTISAATETAPPIIIITADRLASATTRLDVPVTITAELEDPSMISTPSGTALPRITTTAGRLITQPEVPPTISAVTGTVLSIITATTDRLTSITTKPEIPAIITTTQLEISPTISTAAATAPAVATITGKPETPVVTTAATQPEVPSATTTRPSHITARTPASTAEPHLITTATAELLEETTGQAPSDQQCALSQVEALLSPNALVPLRNECRRKWYSSNRTEYNVCYKMVNGVQKKLNPDGGEWVGMSDEEILNQIRRTLTEFVGDSASRMDVLASVSIEGFGTLKQFIECPDWSVPTTTMTATASTPRTTTVKPTGVCSELPAMFLDDPIAHRPIIFDTMQTACKKLSGPESTKCLTYTNRIRKIIVNNTLGDADKVNAVIAQLNEYTENGTVASRVELLSNTTLKEWGTFAQILLCVESTTTTARTGDCATFYTTVTVSNGTTIFESVLNSSCYRQLSGSDFAACSKAVREITATIASSKTHLEKMQQIKNALSTFTDYRILQGRVAFLSGIWLGSWGTIDQFLHCSINDISPPPSTPKPPTTMPTVPTMVPDDCNTVQTLIQPDSSNNSPLTDAIEGVCATAACPRTTSVSFASLAKKIRTSVHASAYGTARKIDDAQLILTQFIGSVQSRKNYLYNVTIGSWGTIKAFIDCRTAAL